MKPMSLAVGTRLGAYEILGMIGAGDIWSTKYVQNWLEELKRLVPVQQTKNKALTGLRHDDGHVVRWRNAA